MQRLHQIQEGLAAWGPRYWLLAWERHTTGEALEELHRLVMALA